MLRRLSRRTWVVSLCLFGLLAGISVPAAASAPASRIHVAMPGHVQPDVATAIRLTLPASAAAVDGRLVTSDRTLELIGVAPVGPGEALRPVPIAGGFAFGAYDLRPSGGAVRLDLVVVSTRTRIDAPVIVESLASRTGTRLLAPGATRTAVARRAQVHGLAQSRTIGRRDIAIARADWEEARLDGRVCGTTKVTRQLDVDGDGCADIVDLQALRAARGRPGLGVANGRVPAAGTRHVRATSRARSSGAPRAMSAAADAPGTIVVDSTADTPDKTPGDGICADSHGDCTLRAAIMESERLAGDITLDFDLPGSAPVTIQLGSRLPEITRLTGTLTIDGYSQPGSSVNTRSYGSNAVPGVQLRGNGIDANEVGLFITSGHNTVRGLLFSDLFRGIFIDTSDAIGNRIMGNWIGFDRTGGNLPKADIGIVINEGATGTVVGSPDREDRNVIGNFRKAIDQYGPHTHGSIIQGNQLCIAPGGADADCSVGIDHDFGPKDGLIGGDDAADRNVIGSTRWEGIELSHGWDRDGSGSNGPWRITGNRVIGNWIGFRDDGRYDSDYRSGWLRSHSDSAGIHVWDGANDNVIARNHIASVFDGIRMRTTQAHGNQLIGNTIGLSPRNEPAPMSGWGVRLEQGLQDALVSGNTIRNTASGGVGLLDTNVRHVHITRNTIGTKGTAIFLASSGGHGANDGVSTPKVTSARISGSSTRVKGTANAGSVVEIYRSSRAAGKPGSPIAYLGRVTVPSGGSWSATVTGLRAGDRVTVLQIRPNGDTSRVSTSVAVR